MQFTLEENIVNGAVLKVIGVGGGGGNAVDHMVRSNVEGVDFVCANTDAQALRHSSASTVIQLGKNGLGAGANPEVGREAALEERDRIAELLQGADMVFVTAGMGGGTGTGAAPVVAEIAKELGILTVAVVTKPFPFEGKRRMRAAEDGITALREHVDSLITIPNEKLEAVLGHEVTLLEAFDAANNVLQNAVCGIADIIIKPGMINVDFADVRTVMSEMGLAMMGTGLARGENRAEEAARMAISSPLLEDVDLAGARGILINITANESLSLGEFNRVGDVINELVDEDAQVIVGTSVNPDMNEDLSVTVVATGIGQRVAGPVAVPSPQTRQRPLMADGRPDYKTLAIPTYARTGEGGAQQEAPQRRAAGSDTHEYMDIPTFLRRQAD